MGPMPVTLLGGSIGINLECGKTGAAWTKASGASRLRALAKVSDELEFEGMGVSESGGVRVGAAAVHRVGLLLSAEWCDRR